MLCLQPYVTEIDLRHSLIPDPMIEQLVHMMPKHNGGLAEGDQEGYDYEKYMTMLMGSQIDDNANGH